MECVYRKNQTRYLEKEAQQPNTNDSTFIQYFARFALHSGTRYVQLHSMTDMYTLSRPLI